MGNKNPPVLPEPVWAQAITSIEGWLIEGRPSNCRYLYLRFPTVSQMKVTWADFYGVGYNANAIHVLGES